MFFLNKYINSKAQRSAQDRVAIGFEKSLAIWFCLLFIGTLPLTAQHRLEVPITSGTDDVEEAGSSSSNPGAIHRGKTDLELVEDGAAGAQTVGLRFQNVALPVGARITYAYIQFTCDETAGTPGTKFITMENTADAAVFDIWPYELTNRNKLGASVAWSNIPEWDRSGAQGPAQRTSNLAELVQEVVDLPDWNSGQSMAFFITGAGTRVADSYDGDPQMAPRLVVEYLDGSYPMGEFPVSRQSVWKYLDGGAVPPADWTTPGFDDSNWANDQGGLGYGNGFETTTLDFGGDPNMKATTYYFRHDFEVSNAIEVDSLLLRIRYDDGIVVYLNGDEILRENMPAGPITSQTLATQAMNGYQEELYHEFRLPVDLEDGQNLLAVEVHQASLNSDDLAFDMEMYPTRSPLAPATLPLFGQAEWGYRDSLVNLDGESWATSGYNASDWQYGQAPLGYGTQSLPNTTLDFGTDPTQKPMTAYFRREVFLTSLNQLPDSLYLGLRRDDGAVVFINGEEVWRSNMPVGTLTANSPAARALYDETEQYATKVISSGYFQPGLNVIGVEVHQYRRQDMDLIFDLEIMPVPQLPGDVGNCSGSEAHISCIADLGPSQPGNRLEVASSHRWQMLVQAGEILPDGSMMASGQHASLFLPGGNSQQGTLWLGYEKVPASLRQLGLGLNTDTHLWELQSSDNHSFDLLDWGETGPLTAGKMTPWGTMAFAEGAMIPGDYNADGRQDQGWILEVDPQGGQITGGKSFAMGRLARRAMAFGPDGKTVYFGSEAGFLYKFVADQYGNLSEGDLFALQLNDPMAGEEPIGRSATWLPLGDLTAAQLENLSTFTDPKATTFGSIESMIIHPSNGQVYFSLPTAGRIYRFTESAGQVQDFEVFAGGQQYLLPSNAGTEWADWGNGPGAMAFDDQGNLWVSQEGTQPRLWMLGAGHTRLSPQIRLVASLPIGTRIKDLTFSDDQRYAFLSVQAWNPGVALQPDASYAPKQLDQDAILVLARKENLGQQAPDAGFISNRQEVFVGENVLFTLATSPQPDTVWWKFEGGFPGESQSMNPEVSYADEGEYAVQLVVANRGGRDTLIEKAYIQVKKNTTNLVELADGLTMQVYPNPVVDRLHLHTDGGKGQAFQAELWTLDGRKLTTLHEGQVPTGSAEWAWKVSDLASGPVLLRVSLGDEQHSQIIWLP